MECEGRSRGCTVPGLVDHFEVRYWMLPPVVVINVCGQALATVDVPMLSAVAMGKWMRRVSI